MEADLPAAYRRLEAAGIDVLGLRRALDAATMPDDRALIYITSLGALRQRDLITLLGLSSATVSRRVAKLLRAERIRQQVCCEGTIGRASAWVLPSEGALPTYAEHQKVMLL